MRRATLAGLAALALLALGITGSALAQPDGPTDDEVNAIAKELYCPVCENVPLDVCPTQACEQWRETIRLLLAEGRTEEEIKAHFVEQYGARVLASPPATGLNWLVYVIPPAAFLGGALLLLRAFRSWRQPTTAAPADAQAGEQDPYVARLEEELRRRR